jgi:protein-tyrosine phosphatase
MSQIDETVWLGSYMSLENTDIPADIVISALTQNEIVSYKVRQLVGDRQWYKLYVSDTFDENISEYFSVVNDILDQAKKSERHVLVHCAAGVSRSATLVIAYIMESQKKSVEDAYAYVKSKRPIIHPNDHFLDQLKNFQEECEKN